MRSVDFEKCWPFNWDGEGGETGRSLPPILSRKFRWWSDELRAARLAAEKPEGIDARVGLEKNADEKVIPIPINESMIETPPVEPPVDGNPVEAAAMAVAVAVEKEGKQVRVPSRGKQRAPKKRSIVELFAVAPPVDTLEDDASGSDVGREADREDGEERDQQVEMRDLGSGDKSGGESLEALRKRKVLERWQIMQSRKAHSHMRSAAFTYTPSLAAFRHDPFKLLVNPKLMNTGLLFAS